MRTPLLLLLAAAIGIGIIYQAGNFTPTATPRSLTKPTVQPTTAATESAPLTLAQARQLTSEQRLDLVKKALLIEDEDQRTASLLPLIQALTKEELHAATDLFRENEMDSGSFKKSSWGTLWVQWGRLDPLGALPFLKNDPIDHDLPTARLIMKGWLETDPAAALAWAQEPKDSFTKTIMAREAIIRSADGDPQKLAASLLALPAGEDTVKFCLDDYFKLVGTTTGNPDAAVIYENIPAPLRDAAWPVAMKRLTKGDLQVAADWLNAHVNDPGRTYEATEALIYQLDIKDPTGTARWTATFPDVSDQDDNRHPAVGPTILWYRLEPDAAKAWLQTQPSNLHWVSNVLKIIEEEDNPKESQEESTEN